MASNRAGSTTLGTRRRKGRGSANACKILRTQQGFGSRGEVAPVIWAARKALDDAPNAPVGDRLPGAARLNTLDTRKREYLGWCQAHNLAR